MISIEEHMTKENKEIDLFKTSYDLRKRSVLLKTLPRKHTFTPDSSKLQTYRETTYFDVSVEIIQPGKRPDIMELSCCTKYMYFYYYMMMYVYSLERAL